MTHPIPLLVECFGRSGSTLTMALLGTSANVLFKREYPFETRLLAYVACVGQVIGSPPLNDSEWNSSTLLLNKVARVGPLPFPNAAIDLARFQRRSTRVLMAAMLKSIDSQGVNPSRPVYYAEKMPERTGVIVNRADDRTKNIVLLRDPRDEFVSLRAFNEKRGYLAFGWRPEETALDFVAKMVKARRKALKRFASLEEGPQWFKLRYEDLVRDPKTVARSLSSWLEVELSPEGSQATTAAFSHHRTSKDAESSLARWRTELEPELSAVFSAELGPELAAVGYES